MTTILTTGQGWPTRIGVLDIPPLCSDRDVGRDPLVRCGLRRDEVIGTEVAKQAFDIIDAIWVQDARIEEIRRAG